MPKEDCQICGGTGTRHNGYHSFPCHYCSVPFINPIQDSLINVPKVLFFDEEDLSTIRELLSHMACGYERTTFYHDCCDANLIIKKIDDLLGVPKSMD